MLGRDDHAASEIVGVLMLIMIVVAASASLATFVLDKQDLLEEQQRFELQKENEEFIFSGISLVDDDDDGDWDEITVTVQPLHNQDFYLTAGKFDGSPLREFTVTRPQQDAPNQYRLIAHAATLPYTFADPYVDPAVAGIGTDRLLLGAREPFQVTINLRASGTNPQGNGADDAYDPLDDTEDFFGTAPAVTDTLAFRIAFSTLFLNEFEQAYIPPTIMVDPRIDCAYDLLTFEVRDVRIHQDGDYALRLDWTATTDGLGGDPAPGAGYQYMVSLAPHADGETITASVVVELASGLRSSLSVPVTLPTGCI